MTAELPVDPLDDVPDALRRGYNVEGRWHGAALLEVAYPEFAPGELPLDVGTFLRKISSVLCSGSVLAG